MCGGTGPVAEAEQKELHAVNLTRGLLCPHLEDVAESQVRFTRIQSTQCEQKLWDAVVMSLGSDLYWHLSRGATVMVHDVSERPRETRACWQGVALIRRACEYAWGLPVTPVTGRGELSRSMEQYFDKVIPRLSDSTRVYLRYWAKGKRTGACRLVSCCAGRAFAVHLNTLPSLDERQPASLDSGCELSSDKSGEKAP